MRSPGIAGRRGNAIRQRAFICDVALFARPHLRSRAPPGCAAALRQAPGTASAHIRYTATRVPPLFPAHTPAYAAHLSSFTHPAASIIHFRLIIKKKKKNIHFHRLAVQSPVSLAWVRSLPDQIMIITCHCPVRRIQPHSAPPAAAGFLYQQLHRYSVPIRVRLFTVCRFGVRRSVALAPDFAMGQASATCPGRSPSPRHHFAAITTPGQSLFPPQHSLHFTFWPAARWLIVKVMLMCNHRRLAIGFVQLHCHLPAVGTPLGLLRRFTGQSTVFRHRLQSPHNLIASRHRSVGLHGFAWLMAARPLAPALAAS